MRTLIPCFIRQNYQQKKYHGGFTAATIFVDISGFTNLTQTLMNVGGSEGAETLSKVLNQVFTPLIDAIHEGDGFVSNFAGDAFTALFPEESGDACLRAVIVAQQIKAFFAEKGTQVTKFGSFELSVKVGVGWGSVTYGILGNAAIIGNNAKKYYFRGIGIDRCTKSEEYAEKGDIVVDNIVQQKVAEIYTFAYQPINNTHSLFVEAKDISSLFVSEQAMDTSNGEVVKYFVPKEVLKFPDAGEFRNVTSVFISFKNADTEEVLNDFVSVVLKYLIEYHGDLNLVDFGDKGGMLVCFFGAPTTHEDDVSLGLNFMLAVRKAYESYPQLIDIGMRAGITVGKVFAGIIGSEQRCHYTSLGGKVNLSARFMTKATWEQVLVSEEIAKTPKFNYKFRGDFAYKGFEDNLPTFELLEKPIEFIQPIFSDTLVGRVEEVENLEKWMQPIFSGKFAGITTVYGEPGIGKSRLAFELEMNFGYGVTWFHCPCDTLLKKSFSPFFTFLKYYFRQNIYNETTTNEENFADKFDYLLERVQETSPHKYKEKVINELIRTRDILAILVGLPRPNSIWPKLDAKGKHYNTIFAIKNLFLAESLYRPVIIHIENMFWIDNSSLELLQFMVRSVSQYAFGLLLTIRYEDNGDCPDLPIVVKTIEDIPQHTIHLKSLEAKHSKDVISNELGGGMGDKLYQFLLNKTKGNPFFIKQLVSYCKEENYIAETSEKNWELITPDLPMVPDTLNSLLLARLDRLDAKIKMVVKIAAVIGDEFELEVLTAAIGKDVTEEIRKATKAQIWTIVNNSHGVFKYVLLRDVTYFLQLKDDLRKRHKKIAETYEALYLNKAKGERPEKYANVAFHYEKAECFEQMIPYAIKAGKFEQQNHRNKEAVVFYDKVLTYIDTYDIAITDKIDVMTNKAILHNKFGEFEKASDLLQTALKLATEVDDKGRLGAIYVELANVPILQSRYDEGIDYLNQALTFYKSVQDESGIGQVYLNLGKIYRAQSEYKKALDLYEDAQELLIKVKDKKLLARTLMRIANIHSKQGRFNQALIFYNQAFALAKKIEDEELLSLITGNIGAFYISTSEYEKAMSYCELKLSAVRKMGNKWSEIFVLNNIGNIYQGVKNFTDAIQIYKQCLEMAEELGMQKTVATIVNNIGGFCWNQGDYSHAIEYYQKSKKLANALKNKVGLNIILLNLAELHGLIGKDKEAILYLKEVSSLANTISNNDLLEGMGKLIEGKLYSFQHKWEDTLISYKKAVSFVRQTNNKTALIEALYHNAMALYHLKKYNEALNINDQALELALKMKNLDSIFKCKILNLKISSEDINKSKEKVILRLLTLLEVSSNEEEIALIYYELWHVCKKMDKPIQMEKYRKKAIAFYENIYVRKRNIVVATYLKKLYVEN